MKFLVRALYGVCFASVIVFGAYRAKALTALGALSAGIIGATVFAAGAWLWSGALLTFFITSTILSRWRKMRKSKLGFAKTERRDAAQVWANGGAAWACAVLSLFFLVPSRTAFLLFLAALASANADTWATEIGAALGGSPVDIRTGRSVRQGTSGAVSAAGTLAALAGAGILACFAGSSWWIVTIAGFAAALGDSVLGATLQAQWQDPADPGHQIEHAPVENPIRPPSTGFAFMTNDAVNFLATVVALFICLCLLRLQSPF